MGGHQVVNEVTGCAVFTGKSNRQLHVLFDNDAVIALESMSGKSAFQILSGNVGVGDVVNLLLTGTAGYARRQGGAVKPLTPERAAKFIIDCGGALGMLRTMLLSLSKAECLGIDSGGDDEDDDEVGELPDDAGPPGRGPTS